MTDLPDRTPCGPNGWMSHFPGWAQLPQFSFRLACREHDAAYTAGGTPRMRRAADRCLYANMLRAIRERPGRVQRAWQRTWAWVFFAAVRALGWMFFGPENARRRSPDWWEH